MQLTLTDVTKVFGTQRAVDEVSFSASTGITGFLGPNGAGKSTTMRMITGFVEPTSGSLSLNGEPIWPTTPTMRARFGYLPEHNPLYPELYVREYLHFIAGVHGLSGKQKAVKDVIDLVGLGLEQNKRIGQLSKGYRQRVGLAQALIHNPEVLVLDEPTNGLDPNQLAEIRKVIRQLGEEKIVLLSTHIMQEVQSLCERVLIINNGKLIADDSIEGLSNRLTGGQRVYVQTQRVISEELLRSLPNVEQIMGAGTERTIVANGETDIRPALANLIAQNNLGLLELRPERQDVEAAFQSLTANQPQA